MAEKNTVLISGFKGINRRCSGGKGEFVTAKNVTADEYPCLAALKAPSPIKLTDVDGNEITGIRAVLCPEDGFDKSFTGVAGTSFYYKGEKIPFFSDAYIPSQGRVELIRMNGNIIICCYNSFTDRCLLYYNYLKHTPYEERASAGHVIRVDCAYFTTPMPYGLKALPAAVSKYDYFSYRIYADSEAILNSFKVGDSIVLCNLKSQYNNSSGITEYQYARNTLIRESRYSAAGSTDEVSCIVTAVNLNKSASYLDYAAYNVRGERVEAKGFVEFSYNDTQRVTDYTHYGPIFRKAMPIMNSICVHNNRLWGVNPNGEYIYASKLGDFKEFNSFKGVASDSYYVGIGSGGKFTGIVSYRNYVIAFKENCLHIISGTVPSNFSVARTIEGIGCIDIRSCAQVGGYLYFLSKDGFYRFDGVGFENISKKLAADFVSAVGIGKNNKYYVYATSSEGRSELFVFDARYDTWHSMSDMGEVVGFFDDYGELYAGTTDSIYSFFAEGCREWELESCEFFCEDCSNSHPNYLWIRARIDKGKTVKVFSSCDSGEFVEHKSCEGTGKIQIYSIPLRWHNSKSHKIKLVGNGGTVIYDMEIKNADGGREYKERRKI